MIQPATRYVLIAAAIALSAVGQNVNPDTIVAAGYLDPAPISVAPGQVITIFAVGVGGALKQPMFAGARKLPTSMAGFSVTIVQQTNILAPILAVIPTATCPNCGVMTAITIQIPYELYQVPPNGGLRPGLFLSSLRMAQLEIGPR
jgi:hypothetical protein